MDLGARCSLKFCSLLEYSMLSEILLGFILLVANNYPETFHPPIDPHPRGVEEIVQDEKRERDKYTPEPMRDKGDPNNPSKMCDYDRS